MGDFVDDAKFLRRRGSVAAADHADRAARSRRGDGFGHGFGAAGEGVELEHARGAVPDDGLRARDHFGKDGAACGTGVEAFPTRGDAFLVGGGFGVRVGCKFIGSHEIDRQMNFHPLRRGLVEEFLCDLRTFRVEEAVSDLHALQHLLEGESHAAADDDLVGLVEQVVDERDLIRDLCAAEDGE